MSISTFVRHLFHSPILRLAIITLIALAYSTPTFCGEIHDAARDGDLQKVKALLKENPELVSGKDNYGLTPLQLAGAKGHKEVAELLLVKEADINARDNDGKTPMKLTVEKGKTDVAELLRQHGE